MLKLADLFCIHYSVSKARQGSNYENVWVSSGSVFGPKGVRLELKSENPISNS